MLARLATRVATGFAVSGHRQTTAMAKKNFYAVVKGKRPGIYRTWEECSGQVKGHSGAVFKGFTLLEEAEQYFVLHGLAPPPPPATAAAAAAAKPAQHWLTAGLSRTQEAQQPLIEPQGAAAADSLAGHGGAAAHDAAPPTQPSMLGRTLRLEFDGASKRNPGPAGFGAVLYDDSTGQEVARLCQYMGDYHTNNQAEYAGLIAGLQAALELGCEKLTVRGDSTLIIKQVLGQYRVKNEGLMPYHAAALELSRRFKSFEARQVPREQNKVADALSNEAITNFTSGRNPHIWTLAGSVKRKAGSSAAAAAAAEAGSGGGSGGSNSPKAKRRKKASPTQ